MASSTTRPIANTNASRVRVLIVKPNKANKENDPINATGIVIKGINEARRLRKKNTITKATKTTASRIVV